MNMTESNSMTVNHNQTQEISPSLPSPSLSSTTTVATATVDRNVEGSPTNREKRSPRSWSEALMMYKIDKSIPVYGSSPLPQVNRVTRAKSSEWRERERQLNPVLQTFVNPIREETQQMKEQVMRARHYSRALDKSVVNTSAFNIVTLDKYPNREGTQRQLYLNKDLPRTESIKITKNHNERAVPPKDPIDRVTRRKKFRKKVPEYDEIYNRYYEDDAEDEQRKMKDWERVNTVNLRRAHELQARSNYYLNPMYPTDPTDIEKLEKQAKNPYGAKRKVVVEHLLHHDSRGYNPLKLESGVINQEVLDRLEKIENIPLVIHTRNNAQERELKERREEKSNIDKFRRTMNKSTHARLKMELTTPYDILSNKLYVGLDAAQPPIHLDYMQSDERKRSVWENAQLQSLAMEQRESLNHSEKRPASSPQVQIVSGSRKKNEMFDKIPLRGVNGSTTVTVRSASAVPQRMRTKDDKPSIVHQNPALKLGKSGRICVDNLVVYPV